MAILHMGMKELIKTVDGQLMPKTNGFYNVLGKNRIILIAAISSLFAFGAIDSSEVQGFTQYVKVTIENAYFSLDGAHINLRDYDNSYVKTVELTDSSTGSTVYVTSSIPDVSTGDSLQACLHTVAERVVCDSRVAYYTTSDVNFYLDLRDAH